MVIIISVGYSLNFASLTWVRYTHHRLQWCEWWVLQPDQVVWPSSDQWWYPSTWDKCSCVSATVSGRSCAPHLARIPTLGRHRWTYQTDNQHIQSQESCNIPRILIQLSQESLKDDKSLHTAQKQLSTFICQQSCRKRSHYIPMQQMT